MIESWKQSGLAAVVLIAAIVVGMGLQAWGIHGGPEEASADPMANAGQPVAFVACGAATGYRKQSPAEMQHVFTNDRFGDGVRVDPFYWAFYQSSFYWIENPHATSDNVVNVAMSAGVLTPDGTTASSQLPICQVPDSLDYQQLWVYDHHVVAVAADSFILTVQVEPRAGNWEIVELGPPVPLGQGLPFRGLRVVDGDGQLLVSRTIGDGRWEFDDQGNVVAGDVSSARSPAQLKVRSASDLEFLCGREQSRPSRLTFNNKRTGATFSLNARACTGAWDVAATVHLSPGDWTIRAASDAYYVVLPKDGPRP